MAKFINYKSSNIFTRKVMVAIIGMGLILTNVTNGDNHLEDLKRFSSTREAEANFLLNSMKSEAILVTDYPYCLESFIDLRKKMLKLQRGPSFCGGNDSCFCLSHHEGKQVWKTINNHVVPIGGLAQYLSSHCNNIYDYNAELSVYLQVEESLLSWRLRANDEGHYSLSGKVGNYNFKNFIPVKPDGEIRLPADKLKEWYIFVRYESLDGDIVYSPKLQFVESSKDETWYVKWKQNS